MLKLTAMVYIIAGSMLAGSCVIAALTMGRMDAVSIAIAAVIGALAALPVSWFVAARLNKAIRPA
ncbi:hypothetical protein [Hoeflea ulvae]|uniref:CTP synthetase n=1 Tax=Hoeflea ulvae TaxID=2983764 RepID=A0ABT3YEZ6_9HYPH|nr:hypothetical protein [Hoeflea ulvae]MCY0094320.1 hypothetical protein [Hoeflea ulvae]